MSFFFSSFVGKFIFRHLLKNNFKSLFGSTINMNMEWSEFISIITTPTPFWNVQYPTITNAKKCIDVTSGQMLGLYCIRNKALKFRLKQRMQQNSSEATHGENYTPYISYNNSMTSVLSSSCDSVQTQYILKKTNWKSNVNSISLLILISDVNTQEAFSVWKHKLTSLKYRVAAICVVFGLGQPSAILAEL